MTDVVLSVLPQGPAFASFCSVHGLIVCWSDPTMAAFDAMGHGSTYHGSTHGH